ncbi:ATP-dependent RNA helicase DDX54 [Chionoecetes opilio]|uniref:RNA helicase n=1 Tax=Chionoecetes opilio TaxID=41210 RepID=A0A8J5CLW1_CHIOP|nr:ATP-dependent RNA helicase DDX54 [Chionoecetes opilio]
MGEEELQGWEATDAPLDGYASEGELDTRKLIFKKNRKNKKSGGFQFMGLSDPVLQGVLKKGYKCPTPIQRKTVPLILEGKDVVAMARTGSGKTACFLIPLFERLQLHSAKTGARALILSPTRELALQTLRFTKEMGRFTGLRAAVVLGGDSLEGQFAAMHDNPDIIIATPGRFMHVCVEMNLKLASVECVVYDEADRLFEMGFEEQLNEIQKRLPETRQTLLFSATLPKMLVEFARAGLTDPVLIRLDTDHLLSENLRVAFFKCNTDDKLALLYHFLQHVIGYREQTVIFAATKHHVEYLHLALDMAHIPNTYCYSSWTPRPGRSTLPSFRQKSGVMMTGCLCAGRVARAGRSGVAYSFVAPDEAAHLMDLHMFLSKELRTAPHPPDLSKKEDWNYMYGSVPQAVLDNEAEQIIYQHDTSVELTKLKDTITGAYKQYVKCRPAASTESVKRMKENERLCVVGYHPLLVDDTPEMEEERLALIYSLKNLQPKGTVFEMIKNRKATNVRSISGMREKRDFDGRRIEAFHKNLEMQQATREEKEAKAKQAQEQVNRLEQSTEDEVKSTFSSIVGQNKREKGAGNSDSIGSESLKRKSSENQRGNKTKKVKKNSQNFKDRDHYIPYTKDNVYADHGYSLGSSFEKEAETAQLDLVQDDESLQRKTTSLHRWDRTKKKFVGTQIQQKRIKTESGAWIAASYKTNRYQKWIEKGKKKMVDDRSDDEDGEENQGKNKNRKNFKTLRPRSYNKAHPLLRDQKGPQRGHKRELRTEDEISTDGICNGSLVLCAVDVALCRAQRRHQS